MSAPTLRPARSTDAGRIGAILAEFVDTTPWMPRCHSRAQDIAHAGDMIARGWVTVAVSETKGYTEKYNKNKTIDGILDVRGVAGFLARAGAEVHALYVAGGARGAGVGSALLSAAQAECDRLNLWTFQANTRAQAFYIARGFTVGARTDGEGNDEGLPDLHMLWKREAV